MITGETGVGEKDFYAELMDEIKAEHVKQAVDMITTLEGRDLQMETLSRLAAELDHALDIRGASTLDLNRARALRRARECAVEMAQNLDLAHANALAQALDRARSIYLFLDYAAQINKTIIGSLSVMEMGALSSMELARIIEARPKSNRGMVIRIVVLVIVICIVVAWVLMLRVQNGVP